MTAMPGAASRRAAHVVASDAEALDIARRLADEFAKGAARRDRERLLPFAELEAFSQSGLWGITVPAAYGGADVSYRTVAKVTEIISAANGRDIKTIINPLVIIAETDDAAETYADAIVAQSQPTGFHAGKFHSDAHAWAKRKDFDNDRQRGLGGGNIQIIGGPAKVADSIARLKAAGIDGVQLSFFDFAPDLALFGERVLPLLKTRGLRL